MRVGGRAGCGRCCRRRVFLQVSGRFFDSGRGMIRRRMTHFVLTELRSATNTVATRNHWTPAWISSTLPEQSRDATILELRDFSRKLVRELGFMRTTLADSELAPSAVHAILEIGMAPGISAKDLGQRLRPGQVPIPAGSSPAWRRQGYVVATRQDSEDARISALSLTAEGRKLRKPDRPLRHRAGVETRCATWHRPTSRTCCARSRSMPMRWPGTTTPKPSPYPRRGLEDRRGLPAGLHRRHRRPACALLRRALRLPGVLRKAGGHRAGGNSPTSCRPRARRSGCMWSKAACWPRSRSTAISRRASRACAGSSSTRRCKAAAWGRELMTRAMRFVDQQGFRRDLAQHLQGAGRGAPSVRVLRFRAERGTRGNAMGQQDHRAAFHPRQDGIVMRATEPLPPSVEELLAFDTLTLREHTEQAGDAFDPDAQRERSAAGTDRLRDPFSATRRRAGGLRDAASGIGELLVRRRVRHPSPASRLWRARRAAGEAGRAGRRARHPRIQEPRLPHQPPVHRLPSQAGISRHTRERQGLRIRRHAGRAGQSRRPSCARPAREPPARFPFKPCRPGVR